VVEHDGIELNNALACRVHQTEVWGIDVDFGGLTRYGLRLVSSSFSEITQNLVHDCIEAILLAAGARPISSAAIAPSTWASNRWPPSPAGYKSAAHRSGHTRGRKQQPDH